jgi:hypothetical protein
MLGEPFDTQAAEETVRHVLIAALELSAAQHRLAIRAVPSASDSPARQLALDAVVLTPIHGLHALECEDLPVTAFDGSNHERQSIGGASAGEHLWCRAAAAGAWVELAVPVPQRGRYRLSVVYTRSFDYGIVQTAVNGQLVGTPVDTFATTIVPGLVVDLGTFDLEPGPMPLRVTVTDKRTASPGYFFGIDCVNLEPDAAAGVP